MKRSEIIEEARTWKDTKWQHQACLKGVACDCIGLIRGVGARWGLTVDPNDLNYSSQPMHKDEELYNTIKKYLSEIPLADVRPGDILLFGYEGWPARHVGILSYDGFVIHTWLDVGKVVESRLDKTWKDSIRFAFRFPGVED